MREARDDGGEKQCGRALLFFLLLGVNEGSVWCFNGTPTKYIIIIMREREREQERMCKGRGTLSFFSFVQGNARFVYIYFFLINLYNRCSHKRNGFMDFDWNSSLFISGGFEEVQQSHLRDRRKWEGDEIVVNHFAYFSRCYC